MGLFGNSGGSGSDAEIKITADTGQAEEQLKNLDTSISKVSQTSTTSLSAIKGFGLGIAATGTAALATIAGLSKMAFSLAAQGENLGSLKAGFDALGGSMKTIDDASERVLGLASRTELLTIANKGLVAGLPDVNENFGNIADLGARLANTLGQDVTSSIEGLTNALARGEKEQLRQYGIIISSQKAMEDYARANNKTVQSLNDVDRKNAEIAAGLAMVEAKLSEIAEVSPSVTNEVSKIGNSWSDLKAEMGEVINTSPSIISSLQQIEQEISAIDPDIFGQLAAEVLDLGVSIAKNLLPNINQIGRTLLVGTQYFKDWGTFAIGAIGAVSDAASSLAKFNFGGLFPGFTQIKKLLGDNETASDDLSKAYEKLSNLSFPTLSKATDTAVENLQELKKRKVEIASESNKTGQAISKGISQEIEKLGKTSKTAGDKVAELIDINKEIKNTLERNDISGIVSTLNDKWAEGVINVNEYKDSLVRIQQEFSNLGYSIENINAGMSGINLSTPTGATGGSSGGGGGFLDALFSESGINQMLTGALGADTTSILMGADPFTAIIANLANAAGELFNIGLRELGEALNIERGGLGDEIGSAIGGIFGEFGSSVGGFLGAITDKIFGGSTNESTRRRRQVEGAIEEIFQTWDFIARDRSGNMVRFEDLVLGERSDFNAGSLFLEQLEGFDDDLRVFFRAIGGGLGVEFADDFVAGAQVGEKLMTAWGGDLDSLQLLLYESGITAEEFEENLVRAFKRGQISAEEFLVSMAKADEMFQPGIVGLGEWERALDNFIESGGRGTQSMKSLRDMFIEFRELNPNGTFEDFRSEMIASGRLTAEEADTLFDSMRLNGINTFEELMEASDRTIITILANMQQAGFGFIEPLEAVQEKLDSVESALDRLGTGSTIPITLRIRSEFDSRETESAFSELDRTQGIGLIS